MESGGCKPGLRLPSYRELTENRKEKQKQNLEKFWSVVKDYKLPMNLEEVELALKSKEEWSWNLERMSHGQEENEQGLKELLETLHFQDFTIRAGMNAREESLLFIGWVESMKKKIELECKNDMKRRLESIRKVFLFLLKELSRQLGIACNERGLLIERTGIIAEEYFCGSEQALREKSEQIERGHQEKFEDMVEALRVKEQELNRRVSTMKSGWEIERAQIHAKLMEKDSEVSSLANKLQVSVNI